MDPAVVAKLDALNKKMTTLRNDVAALQAGLDYVITHLPEASLASQIERDEQLREHGWWRTDERKPADMDPLTWAVTLTLRKTSYALRDIEAIKVRLDDMARRRGAL